MSAEILIRRETADERLAVGATYMDDIDLIQSPITGLLVMVAVKGGRHVCQQCGGHFIEGDNRLRGVEVSLAPGSPKLLLHAKCEDKKIFIQNKFRGLEIRRGLAKVARASIGIAEAAIDSAKTAVGGLER